MRLIVEKYFQYWEQCFQTFRHDIDGQDVFTHRFSLSIVREYFFLVLSKISEISEMSEMFLTRHRYSNTSTIFFLFCFFFFHHHVPRSHSKCLTVRKIMTKIKGVFWLLFYSKFSIWTRLTNSHIQVKIDLWPQFWYFHCLFVRKCSNTDHLSSQVIDFIFFFFEHLTFTIDDLLFILNLISSLFFSILHRSQYRTNE